MKTINYFLFFLLILSFSSTAQEENAGITIRSCRGSINYYIDGVKVEPAQRNKISDGLYYIGEYPQGPTALPIPRGTVKWNAYNSHYLMREKRLDLAFHNTHTGQQLGMVIRIDSHQFAKSDYLIATSANLSFWEAEHYDAYGEEHWLQPSGIIKTSQIFYYSEGKIEMKPINKYKANLIKAF